MRSRYSAYALQISDYLQQTWHAHYRPQDLTLQADIKWIGLQIIEFQSAPESASVEFEARLLHAGKVEALHELSRFVLQQGQWLYTSGDPLMPSFSPYKPGRNEICPCGSGSKFKRCCGID